MNKMSVKARMEAVHVGSVHGLPFLWLTWLPLLMSAASANSRGQLYGTIPWGNRLPPDYIGSLSSWRGQ